MANNPPKCYSSIFFPLRCFVLPYAIFYAVWDIFSFRKASTQLKHMNLGCTTINKFTFTAERVQTQQRKSCRCQLSVWLAVQQHVLKLGNTPCQSPLNRPFILHSGCVSAWILFCQADTALSVLGYCHWWVLGENFRQAAARKPRDRMESVHNHSYKGKLW